MQWSGGLPRAVGKRTVVGPAHPCNRSSFVVGAQARLSFFLCPSAPDELPSIGVADKAYGKLSSTGYLALTQDSWPPDQAPFGLTHYLGVSGVWGRVGQGIFYFIDNKKRIVDDELLGVFSVRSKTSLAQVTDGTSQTLMFGEAPGTYGTNMPYNFENASGRFDGYTDANAWAGWGTLPAAFGLDLSPENNSPIPSKAGAHYMTKWLYYGSLNAGNVVQFCFVDGSVRSLNKDIRLETFQYLSTMGGQEVLSEADLL